MNTPIRLVALSLLFVSAHAGAQTVYRCDVNGVVTFSDRPCGGDAQVHEPVVEMNTYEAPPVSKVPAPVTRKSARPARASASDASKRQETCARLTRTLKEIRSRMRSGYNAKQGERLREREDKAQAQARQLRCR